MAFFDSFTDSLKQKWLQFFQANRDWITVHMTVESVYTPDGGKRPSSYLILGVVNALEPKLAQLMFPFAKLNPDADTLIEVLDLNFDPDIVLGNRVSPLVEPERFSNQPTLILEEKTTVEVKQETFVSAEVNNLHQETITEEFAVEVEPQATWEESTSFTEANSFGEEIPSEDDAFTNVSFEEPEVGFGEISGLEETDFGALGGSEETAFGEFGESEDMAFGESASLEDKSFDVVSDIWGEETSETLEELPSDFNESEMDRLFPNN